MLAATVVASLLVYGGSITYALYSVATNTLGTTDDSHQVLVSKESFYQDLFKMAIAITLTTFGLILLIAARIYWSFYKSISSPVTELFEGVQKIQKGNYNVHFDEHWGGELGKLAKAFNGAIQELSRREQEIRNHIINLESLVAERTRELDDQRAKNINASKLASLGEVSAGISHEINNPLAIIEGKAQTLRRILKESNATEEAQAPLLKISEMVKRIEKIIKGLRAFARDASHDPMFPTKMDKIFTDVLDLCSARMMKHGVDLQLILPDQNLKLYAREVQIDQVLVNLINNAFDAIAPLKEKWIRIEAIQKNEWTEISVTDSGQGIPADVAQKMMQPFFTTKEIGKGTGLGLSIAMGIIKDHGGDLRLDRDCPNTRFVITLPSYVSKQKLAA